MEDHNTGLASINGIYIPLWRVPHLHCESPPNSESLPAKEDFLIVLFPYQIQTASYTDGCNQPFQII